MENQREGNFVRRERNKSEYTKKYTRNKLIGEGGEGRVYAGSIW